MVLLALPVLCDVKCDLFSRIFLEVFFLFSNDSANTFFFHFLFFSLIFFHTWSEGIFVLLGVKGTHNTLATDVDFQPLCG